MYKTGDLAKRTNNGLLEYAGRKDHQIKLKGYRIELGEIELALLSLEEIEEAVVIDFDDSQGRKQLAAYVVSSAPTPVLELRKSFLANCPFLWFRPTLSRWTKFRLRKMENRQGSAS